MTHACVRRHTHAHPGRKPKLILLDIFCLTVKIRFNDIMGKEEKKKLLTLDVLRRD